VLLFFIHFYFNIQQGWVLLATEDVRFPRAPTRFQSLDRKLDRVGRIELDEIGDPFQGNPIEGSYLFLGDGPTFFHLLVDLLFTEDYVEGNSVGPRVFASYRLC